VAIHAVEDHLLVRVGGHRDGHELAVGREPARLDGLVEVVDRA
jgi:hypothetical protein